MERGEGGGRHRRASGEKGRGEGHPRKKSVGQLQSRQAGKWRHDVRLVARTVISPDPPWHRQTETETDRATRGGDRYNASRRQKLGRWKSYQKAAAFPVIHQSVYLNL